MTVDGIKVPVDRYKLVDMKNGMTKLVIDKEYLALLKKGAHEVTMSIQGTEVPISFVINVK